MQKNAKQKAEPTRTIHHTVSGGHSVDRAKLLRSERVRKVISEVADKFRNHTGKETWPIPLW